MKKRQAAVSAAILGLACFGESPDLSAEDALTSSDSLFSAVDNAVTSMEMSDAPEEGSASASGAAVETVSASTGNANTVGVARATFDACSSGDNMGSQFQDDCTLLVEGAVQDEKGTAMALSSLTPDQILALRTASAQQVKAGISVATMRMSTLRLGSQSLDSLSSELIAANGGVGGTGGGASGDLQIGRGAAFFNVKYLNAQQDGDQYTYGYDPEGVRFTLGGDYRLQENMILGLFGSYSSGRVDYSNNKGKMDSTAWGMGIYGTYYWNNGGFLEGVLGYDFNDYDLTRRIDYSIEVDGLTTRVRQDAKSSPESGVFYASLGGGYNFDSTAFTFTPSLSLNYLHNETDSYQERMSDPGSPGGSLAIAYDSQTFTSFTSRIGFVLAKAVSSTTGVFVPQLSLDWVHEFSADQDRLNARFVNDLSGAPVIITTTSPDRNYFDLGLGISAQFAQGRSAFLSVNSLLGYEDLETYSITGGVRIEF